MTLPAGFASPGPGIWNSVRYHHAGWNGLSAGIGSSVKRSPMGYVVPGIRRRFIPK